LKAVILSAGKGTRLKKYTSQIPKPMILYKGKPILEYNIELCQKFGIKEIYINQHYLKEKIIDYFGNGEKFGVHIQYSYEEKLLGTAGALNNFRQYLTEPFFVIYGDNISNFNFDLLKEKFYEKREPLAVIGFHYREDVSQSGVAEFGKDDIIVNFIEKPKEGTTTSKWVNAGVYFVSPKILDYIPPGFSDFSKNIFPKLLEEKIPFYGVKQLSDVKAFDTPELLTKHLETG